MLQHGDWTGRIIGAAIEVHKELGPGFLESLYENALCVELRRRHVPFARQVSIPVLYRGVEVGLHRLGACREKGKDRRRLRKRRRRRFGLRQSCVV
jgi:hypothetical protein